MIKPPCGRRSCRHRLVPTTSSSEPPTSVGLACRPVGAWRRHLVKQPPIYISPPTPWALAPPRGWPVPRRGASPADRPQLVAAVGSSSPKRNQLTCGFSASHHSLPEQTSRATDCKSVAKATQVRILYLPPRSYLCSSAAFLKANQADARDESAIPRQKSSRKRFAGLGGRNPRGRQRLSTRPDEAVVQDSGFGVS